MTEEDSNFFNENNVSVRYNKVKESNPVTGPVVAQRGGRGIALLFQDLGARRE